MVEADSKFISGGVALHGFLIDVVQPVVLSIEEDMEEGYRADAKVQLITYKVLARDPQHAMQRFFQEEAGQEVYRGEMSDRIVVGIQVDNAGVYNVS
jgi:hypothetical protein